ncbi:ABC transporter permease [Undibacterium sp. Jales W-56]|uniref:ABC transporter permease n=1 Tax=Undibacterium sp. Jales W-56 TaxID=2897325 RepID=UPI0021CFB127|nr:ABC transporter permease [Undibacterium sp. Jales W-56]MCU6433246.1 ABC transporter permease [Undibacterium sp. Jales W-56]
MNNQKTSPLLIWLLLVPALMWLFMLIIFPHIEMLTLSMQERIAPQEYQYGIKQYATFFNEPLYWRTFLRTACMSVIATLFTFILAFPVAWYIAKIAKNRSKLFLMTIVVLPFWVSEMVRTLGWIILLRSNGVIPQILYKLGVTEQPVELLYADGTVLLGLVYSSLLFMLVPLINALETLDDSLVEAAYDLGGNRFNILRQIVIPHAAPGIAAGSIMVFMLTLGNYLTPVLLGGKNSMWFTEQIYTQFITRFNWPQGAALAFILLSLSSLLVWIGLKLSGQSFDDVMRRA